MQKYIIISRERMDGADILCPISIAVPALRLNPPSFLGFTVGSFYRQTQYEFATERWYEKQLSEALSLYSLNVNTFNQYCAQQWERRDNKYNQLFEDYCLHYGDSHRKSIFSDKCLV